MLDPVELLKQLVAIPSVNPMGLDHDGPEFLEAGMTDFLQRFFDRLGLPWKRQTVEPRRDNIVAWFAGDVSPDDGGEVVMWEAHQDTVPVDGMTIDPFDPIERDGRIYGRGSCDIKGGMAAMLAALARLVEQRPKPTPSILMACTINEEHGFTGATALAETWKSPGAGPFERRPDAAIVAEPTMLDVVAAHKGVVRWRCHTSGRAVHSSRPELGQNAIYAMAPVVAALEAYQREAVPTLGEHARCGRASLSVGVIGGGISVNTVPDRCTIQIDYRLLPDADPLAAQQEVIRYVAERHPSPERVLHDEPYMASGGLHDDQNASLAERVRRSAASVHPGCKSIGVPYGTDASVFCAAGVPTVVVGPGDIAQAHTADEFLEIDQLRRATEFYYQLACGE